MSKYWDLTSLYASFDDPKMEQDLLDVKQEIKNLEKWFEESLGDEQISDAFKMTHILRALTSIDFTSSRYAAYARLTASTDTKNQTAIEKLNFIEAIMPDVTKLEVRFQEFVSQIEDLDTVISSSPYLEKHAFILQEIVAKNAHSLNSETEGIIARMKNTGSTAWTKLHQQLLSNLEVELPAEDGLEAEVSNISAVRNLANSPNQQVRRRAYESELKSYDKITLPMSACINGIKGESITQAELRGFSSVLDMTLFQSRMDQEMLDALLEAMEEALPIIRKFLKKKSAVLGHREGLPWYEITAPLGKDNGTISYEEAQHIVYDNFKNFNPALAEFAQMAFDKNWIDVEPKVGKRGGAFCSNLPIGESRILLNFTGALTNVITLAHELGHGYHGHCLKDEEFLNRDYTMPIAETASTFCETIIIKSALANWDESRRFSILNDQVTRYVAIIMDIYSRFLFEKALVDKRKTSTLSVDQLCDLMAEAQEKAYGDGLDHRYNHPYMWVNKVHYYYAGRNYYNFPYAFGLLLAKGLYAMYEQEGDSFLPKYDTFLRETGKNDIYHIGKSVGIDLRDVDFFRGGLQMIKDDIEAFMKLLDDTRL